MGQEIGKALIQPLAGCCESCQKYVLNSADLDIKCSDCCSLGCHTHEVTVEDEEKDDT